MALRKIVKNISGQNLQVINVELLPAESYELPYSQWFKAADSDILKTDINLGLVILNDGTRDLSISESLDLLVQFQTETNSIKNFSYNNVVGQVIIPENQQMIVKKRIKITDRLIIRGQLCLI